MARKAADLYLKVVRLNESGAIESTLYQSVETMRTMLGEKMFRYSITQQAYSNAKRRGATCKVRVEVPAGVEVGETEVAE